MSRRRVTSNAPSSGEGSCGLRHRKCPRDEHFRSTPRCHRRVRWASYDPFPRQRSSKAASRTAGSSAPRRRLSAPDACCSNDDQRSALPHRLPRRRAQVGARGGQPGGRSAQRLAPRDRRGKHQEPPLPEVRPAPAHRAVHVSGPAARSPRTRRRTSEPDLSAHLPPAPHLAATRRSSALAPPASRSGARPRRAWRRWRCARPLEARARRRRNPAAAAHHHPASPRASQEDEEESENRGNVAGSSMRSEEAAPLPSRRGLSQRSNDSGRGTPRAASCPPLLLPGVKR